VVFTRDAGKEQLAEREANVPESLNEENWKRWLMVHQWPLPPQVTPPETLVLF
jgi:hypothetical protein